MIAYYNRSEYAVQISRLIGNETKPWANYTSMPTFQVNPITGKHVIVKDTSSNYVSVVTFVSHNRLYCY